MSDMRFSAISAMRMGNIAARPVATRVEPPTFSTIVAQPMVVEPANVEPAKVAEPMIMTELLRVAEPARIIEPAPVTIVPTAPAVINVPLARPDLTPRIENLRFIDPTFTRKIIDIRTPTEGVPRSQIVVPISPNENVTDELLFEAAADAAKKFYVPRYRIAQQNVSGRQRYQIALEQSGEEWTLTVHLQKYAAPAIAEAARDAAEMGQRIAVILKHNQSTGGQVIGQEEMEFKEITQETGGIRAVLRGNNITERDLLYQALTDPAYGATLIVRNWVTVAVPVPQANKVVRDHREPIVRDHRIPRPVIPVDRTRPGPQGNVIVRDHRKARLMGAVMDDSAASMRADFVDARLSMPRAAVVSEETAADSDAPTEPLFRQVDRVLEDKLTPDPFVFPPALHGYIFGSISATPGQQFELTRHTRKWKGRWHSYYQNPVRSHQFYYLPDAFKIARRPQSPHDPVMSVRFGETDGSIDNVAVTLDYIALPYVDPNRLQAASVELMQELTGPLPPGVSTLSFEPLLNAPDKTQLRLAIPRADATAGPFAERQGALIDLRSGIHDSLSLPMKQFRAIYDAMFGSSDILFSGTVLTNLGTEQEPIPFSARMNDLAGEIFDYTEEKTAEGIKATLRNAIESPVQISSLAVEFRRGQERFPATIQGLDFSAPIQVGPRQQLSFQVVPGSPLQGEGALSAEYDLDGVQVIPDKEAVWNAILDPSVSAVYSKAITVKTFKQKFDPPHDNPDNQIMAIVVDFESGQSVELNADNLERSVTLPLPISSYVLGKEDLGQYRYKVRVIRLAGETADAQPRTHNTSLLFLTDVK